MGNHQFLHVVVSAADPFERGMQYGQQAAGLIKAGIAGYQRHFQKAMGQTWNEIVERSALYIPFVEFCFPEEFQEVLGIAEGSGASVNEIMALNCRYEILKLKPKECTTGAILQDATADGKIYLVQNWDYRPWVENHAVVVDIDDRQGTHIIGVTEAGQLVRNGMNNHGIGLCANNLTSIYDTGEIGAPVTFVRRRALNSRNFEQLCQVIRESQRGVSCNFMLASAENKAVDLEATPGAIFQVFPQNGVLTHANHMVAGAAVCTNQGTKFRDRVLGRILRERYGELDLDAVFSCLKNHERFPGSKDIYPDCSCIEAVCSHVPLGDFDEDRVWKTIASSVYNLTDGIAYICKGCPCENRYTQYAI